MTVTLTVPTVNSDNGTWGTTVNAALNQINGYDVFAVKSADESVTSSTTLQDDDHLTGLAIGAGTYVVQAMYLVSGAAAGDVKVAWAFSGTATGYRGGIGPASNTTTALTGANVRSAAAADTAATITGSASYGVDGTNWSYISETGVLVVTVAGSLKVQWAQLASSATATILRAGSYVWARRVA